VPRFSFGSMAAPRGELHNDQLSTPEVPNPLLSSFQQVAKCGADALKQLGRELKVRDVRLGAHVAALVNREVQARCNPCPQRATIALEHPRLATLETLLHDSVVS
jgi:hypothetical protein